MLHIAALTYQSSPRVGWCNSPLSLLLDAFESRVYLLVRLLRIPQKSKPNTSCSKI
jgi:hypothetical protein